MVLMTYVNASVSAVDCEKIPNITQLCSLNIRIYTR